MKRWDELQAWRTKMNYGIGRGGCLDLNPQPFSVGDDCSFNAPLQLPSASLESGPRGTSWYLGIG